MTMMLATAALGKVPVITVSADWGSSGGASPITSATRTLTVTGANPGNIRWNVVSNDATLQYSKNGGAFATVTDEATISVANGDTIAFKFTGVLLDGANVEVYDDTTEDQIGSWTATVTS